MIRSSKLKIQQLNVNRSDNINHFIESYSNVVKQFIDIFWPEQKKIESNPSKTYTDQIKNSDLSARAIQAAAKQAAGIINGTIDKHLKRQYIIKKLNESGQFKKARKLQRRDEKLKCNKPNINIINPELDSRFYELDFNNKTTFDGWITLFSLFNKRGVKIYIPVNKHKHFNKFFDNKDFELKHSILLSKKYIEIRFEKEIDKVEEGKIIGFDVGIKTMISSSDDQITGKDIHGHTLESIIAKKSRCKYGSKGYKRAQTHEKNYIRWALNQLNFQGVKTVKVENLTSMNKYKRLSRQLKGFTYEGIFDMLKLKLESLGVHLVKVPKAFTSQRCSNCGWVRKANRSGKTFKCDKCGFTYDADLNASKNIALDLEKLNFQKIRSSGLNRKGFYWNQKSEECIVPHT